MFPPEFEAANRSALKPNNGGGPAAPTGEFSRWGRGSRAPSAQPFGSLAPDGFSLGPGPCVLFPVNALLDVGDILPPFFQAVKPENGAVFGEMGIN
ncbi:hypothetical protein I4200191B4_00240 [Pseudoflavonifractor gallinarum]